MKHITTVSELSHERSVYASLSIGYVPTMGYLHEGHLSLIRRAKRECDIVVLSIFVNPLQFGENEDFDQYPRDLARDMQLAEQAGVDLLFQPSVKEMYPNTPLTNIQVSRLTKSLCGRSRPGHFDGVCTVVSKLFHLVQPDRAYFGLKDVQQVAVMQQMVDDLNFPVEIVPCEIVRESDGLAMSSRNVYLSAEERSQATILNQALQEVKGRQWSTADEINQYVRERIRTQPLAQIDYVETCTYPTLEPLDQLTGQPAVVAVAVYFGSTRLIDNVLLQSKGV